MSDNEAFLVGELDPWPSKAALADLLEQAGLKIQVGRHAIRLTEADHFVFQSLTGDIAEPRLDADADDAAQLMEIAARVSAALAANGVRHRFEIYQGRNPDPVGYFNHQWPA